MVAKKKSGYKVSMSDGHNDDLVYVFRDQDHFIDWLFKRDSEFNQEAQDQFREEGSWTDGNFDEWSEYSGRHQIDMRDQ